MLLPLQLQFVLCDEDIPPVRPGSAALDWPTRYSRPRRPPRSAQDDQHEDKPDIGTAEDAEEGEKNQTEQRWNHGERPRDAPITQELFVERFDAEPEATDFVPPLAFAQPPLRFEFFELVRDRGFHWQFIRPDKSGRLFQKPWYRYTIVGSIPIFIIVGDDLVSDNISPGIKRGLVRACGSQALGD